MFKFKIGGCNEIGYSKSYLIEINAVMKLFLNWRAAAEDVKAV